MGLKEWFLKRFYGVSADTFKELKGQETAIAVADEYLKRAMRDNSDALKLAERVNRANLLNSQTKQLREKLHNYIDDEDDDADEYDEDDDADDTLNDVFGNIVKSVISPKVAPAPVTGDAQPSPLSDKELIGAVKKRFPNLEKYDDEFCLEIAKTWASRL